MKTKEEKTRLTEQAIYDSADDALIERVRVEAESVFRTTEIYASYKVELLWNECVAGSIPSHPTNVMEMTMRRWEKALKVKDEISVQNELRRRAAVYLEELGEDLTGLSGAQIEELARQKSVGDVNTFLRNKDGLYLANHCVKSAMKEAVNILFPYNPKTCVWGPTKKAMKSYLAERVFIEPRQLPLMRDGRQLQRADGIEVVPGRVKGGSAGERSVISQFEFLVQPTVSFTLHVLNFCNSVQDLDRHWPKIFRQIEKNGVGPMRKMTNFGTVSTKKFVPTDSVIEALSGKKVKRVKRAA